MLGASMFRPLFLVLLLVNAIVADDIYFFPTFGVPATGSVQSNEWEIPIMGYAYENWTFFETPADYLAQRVYKLAQTSEEKDRVSSMLKRFLKWGLSRTEVSLHLGSNDTVIDLMKKTTRSGFFNETVTIQSNNTIVTLSPNTKDDYGESVDIYLTPNEGTVVISDIDDTIKETGVNNQTETLINTFVKEFTSVGGSSECYQFWRKSLREIDGVDPLFYYISGSPWPIGPVLRSFLRREKFPMGPMMMKKFSLFDGSAFGLGNTEGIQKYKLETLRYAMSKLSSKKFILIGDSTQVDPQVYAELYEGNPTNIQCIIIRIVEGYDPEKEVELNHPLRFEEVFANVPRHKWILFKDYSEIKSSELQKICHVENTK